MATGKRESRTTRPEFSAIPSAPAIGAPTPMLGMLDPPHAIAPEEPGVADSGAGPPQLDFNDLLAQLPPATRDAIAAQFGLAQSALGGLGQITGAGGPLNQREQQLSGIAGGLFKQYSDMAGQPLPASAPSLNAGQGLGALAAGMGAELYGRGQQGPTAFESLAGSKETNRQTLLMIRANQLQSLHDQAMVAADRAAKAGDLNTAVQYQGKLAIITKLQDTVAATIQEGLKGEVAQKVAETYASSGIEKSRLGALGNVDAHLAAIGITDPAVRARLMNEYPNLSAAQKAPQVLPIGAQGIQAARFKRQEGLRKAVVDAKGDIAKLQSSVLSSFDPTAEGMKDTPEDALRVYQLIQSVGGGQIGQMMTKQYGVRKTFDLSDNNQFAQIDNFMGSYFPQSWAPIRAKLGGK